MKTQSVFSALFLATSTITVTLADTACSGGLNVILGLFGQNSAIQSYCTASYPIYTTTTLTSTSTSITTPVTTSTSTVTQTTTVDSLRRLRDRQVVSSAVSAALGPLAILQGQAQTAIKTYCSCNEKPQTVRTTTTTTTISTAPTSTTTTVTTTTATVVRPKCASPGSNLVQNGGFENGLNGWSLHVDTGSASASSPGENSALSFAGFGNSDGTRATVTQTGISVRGGITYTVQFSGRTDTANAANSVSVGVDDTTGSRPEPVASGSIGLSNKSPNTWYQKSFSWTPPADTIVQIRVSVTSSTGNVNMNADNISIICS